MRLENFLALTHAKLENEPCVNSFENTVFEAHRVKRGDIFFAYDEEDIALAVSNGAYGIVFDKPVQVSDQEIAWIKVNNIEEAIKRLLRFKMIEKEVVAYECNEIILKLALQVITQTSFVVVHGDIKAVFKSLWEIEDRTTILFCPTLNSKDMFANVKTLSKIAIEPIEIMEQTLFETSFIYDNIFYERQLISPFFIPYLAELLHLFKSLKIDFRLRKFTPIEHFEAVFTNKNFEIKEFGASDKVLIFEQNTSLIDSEITFLHSRAPWAKIICILPSFVNQPEDENVHSYKHQKEILPILKENSFHFALIVGVDKSILNRTASYQTQPTLF
jgi:ferrochelatase